MPLVNRHRHDLLRAGLGPGQALLGDRVQGERVVQHAAQEVRLAPQAAVHLPQGQRGRRRATTRSRATSSRRTSTSSSPTRSSRRSRRRRRARSTSSSSCRSRRSTAIYFDKAYYLGPDKGGDRAYRLLAEAMQRDRARRARPVRGARQAVPRAAPAAGTAARDAAAALRRRGAPDRPRCRCRDGEVKDAELKLADAAHRADRRTRRSSPRTYQDEVRERVLETIQRKVEGQEITSRRRRGAAGARSSTSWRRSRRASPRAAAGNVGEEEEDRGRGGQAGEARGRRGEEDGEAKASGA